MTSNSIYQPRNARIEDAARAYCKAVKDNEQADYTFWEQRRAELDRSLHELMLACGFECSFCEAGSCPGLT